MPEICDNCGSVESEWFRFWSMTFDVTAANKLVTPERETRVLPENYMRGLGLPLDPITCDNCEAEISVCNCGKKAYSMPLGTAINEEHLSHLTDLDRPGIIAVILHKKKKEDVKQPYSAVLIDGNHRAVRAYREKREFKIITLTPQETWDILDKSSSPNLVNPNTKAGKKALAELGWDKSE
jgi:hypothetical protein